MLLSYKQSLMKWYLMWMCLLFSWKTGFLARARADLLFTFSSTIYTFLLRSSTSILDSHNAYVVAVVVAMYFASQLERATTFCLRDC